MSRPRNRPEKKSEMIEVRVAHSQKQALLDHCRAHGLSASEVVRNLIDSELSSGQQRMVFNLERMKSMALFSVTKPGVAAAAALGAASLVAVLLSPATSAGDADAAFDALDADRSGTLALDEFIEAVSAEGFAVAVTDRDEEVRGLERDAAREFHRYDRNGNGLIDRAEFSYRYLPVMEASFAALDADDDGYISREELVANFARGGIVSMNSGGREGPAELGNRYIGMLDSDGDGRIDLQEFFAIS